MVFVRPYVEATTLALRDQGAGAGRRMCMRVRGSHIIAMRCMRRLRVKDPTSLLRGPSISFTFDRLGFTASMGRMLEVWH